MEIKPNIALGIHGASASASGVGSTLETSGTENKWVRRNGVMQENTHELVRLCWSFDNDGSNRYPASHSIIILISRNPSAKPPPFIFKLTLDKAEVQAKSKLANFLRPNAPGSEFRIRGNHQPTRVSNMLKAYRDKTSEYQNITLVKLAGVNL